MTDTKKKISQKNLKILSQRYKLQILFNYLKLAKIFQLTRIKIRLNINMETKNREKPPIRMALNQPKTKSI